MRRAKQKQGNILSSNKELPAKVVETSFRYSENAGHENRDYAQLSKNGNPVFFSQKPRMRNCIFNWQQPYNL